MGKLKPIGSEKLEGMAKIQRMIEIARYKENKPQIVNENSSNEYSVKLSDGLKYHIIKEKNGYVIKKGLNESTLDYIEPMKGRKFYTSYSQALKRLNLITKEVNSLEGNERNISLFTEGEEGEKKYFLRKKQVNEQPTAPAPAPAPAATTQTTTASLKPPTFSSEMTPEEKTALDSTSKETAPTDTAPTPDETEPTDDMVDDMGDETEQEPETETVTFKHIQKIVGKLGQKLRAFNADEENKMSSKDIKYVINSVLSALNLEDLDDDDRESILNKLEGEEIEGEDEESQMSDDDEQQADFNDEPPIEDEEEVEPTPPTAPTPAQPTEGYHSIDEDDYSDFKMENDYSTAMDEMIEGIFSESKVDKILKKYFKLDEKERKIVRETKERKNVASKISKLSENIVQEVAARKFYTKNKNVKFLGKNNNNSLVFESNNRKVTVNNRGQII